jgi:hypothetical protein
MKSMLFSLLLVVSPVFANVCDGDWSDVQESGYYAAFPSVGFDAVSVKANQVCRNGDKVQTVNPVNVCVKPAKGNSSNCAQYASVVLERSLVSTKEVPVKGNSSAFRIVRDEVALDYDVQVGTLRNGFSVVCSKEYSISDCQ